MLKIGYYLLDNTFEFFDIEGGRTLFDGSPLTDDLQNFIPALVDEFVQLLLPFLFYLPDPSFYFPFDFISAQLEIGLPFLPIDFLFSFQILSQQVYLEFFHPFGKHQGRVLLQVEQEKDQQE